MILLFILKIAVVCVCVCELDIMSITKIVISYSNGYHSNTNVKEQALIYVI